jgi:hypothetical protein
VGLRATIAALERRVAVLEAAMPEARRPLKSTALVSAASAIGSRAIAWVARVRSACVGLAAFAFARSARADLPRSANSPRP